MEEKTTRHGNILFIVCFFLNQTTKKRKKEKGKQIVTEILKKNARGKEVTEKKQRCLLKNAVCFHLCGKT
jgi:hypothetical protein